MAARRVALALATLLALASTRIAGAQGSAEREAAAEVLFEEARKLMAAGKYAEACPKFAESHHIDPGVGVLLFLADCYEKNGQTASAWATFRSVVPMARAAGQPDRVRTATERSNALERRLSKLEIVVIGDGSDLTIFRDGDEVARPLWGTAVAVDPGPSTIEARGPGKQAFRQTVEVPPGPTVVRVEVPELMPESSSTGPREVERPATRPGDTAERREQTTMRKHTVPPPHKEQPAAGRNRTPALVAGAIGVAGVVAGSVFGLLARSAWNEATGHCDGNPPRCDEPAFELADTAERHAIVSTIAFAVGAAGIGTAVVLWVTAPEKDARGGGAGLGAAGRF